MTNLLVLTLFCAALVACIALDISILFALAFGLALFLLHGRRKGFAWRELGRMTLDGVKTVKNILLTFVLIGVLTAFWRASGTIAVIVYYASALIRPSVFLLMTFLLNCGVSVLTGTSFGTSATVGVVCATLGAALGVDPRLVGGAVLSGVFFGDRCSPVSTSVLLVAELTGTTIFDNIRRMLRSALVPFLMSCAVYAALGLSKTRSGTLPDLRGLFEREFVLHWTALIPALVILALSTMRVNVKLAMTASILSAIPLCVLLQHIAPVALIRVAITGFRAADGEIAGMFDGGGIASMLKVGAIVCLSSSYSGIFQKTGLLNGAKQRIAALGKRATPYAATLCTSVVAGMIACNQTLATMLTAQLCGDMAKDAPTLANDLEDSAIVVSPLVPWSIAGSVPLSTIGAPTGALLFACYLYLLPLWRLGRSFVAVRSER